MSRQHLSQAGQLFQSRLLDSIADAGLDVSAVFLQRPVPSFPRYRRFLFGREPGYVNGKFHAEMLPFVNWGPLKTATISVALFLNLLRWAMRHRAAANRVILLYNLAAPPAVVSLLAAKLARAQVYAIVADVQVPGNGLVRWSVLRWVEFKLQIWAMPMCTGLIVLTKRIANDFAPNTASILMEGAVPEDERGGSYDYPESAAPVSDDVIVLMYAGGLSALKGVPLLLDAMALLPQSRFRLWVTGEGPLRGAVEQAAALDDRIVYLGYLPHSEVVARMHRASILVNPHATDLASARYVFPSKLLEYIATGTPVITTCSTPEIARDYGDVCFLSPLATPEAFAATIERVAKLGRDERRRIGEHARCYVLSNKSWKVQGGRIASFIRESAGTRGAVARSQRALQ